VTSARSRPGSAAPVPGVLVHELFERGDGGGGRRECVDFVAHVPCALAVGGIAEHCAHRCADCRGVALGWPDDACGPEGWQRLAQLSWSPAIGTMTSGTSPRVLF
jgi:hypothetical protein